MAQRFNREGRSMFVVSLPLHLVATHLPIPDPDEPFEGNRRVNYAHAARFGQYWRDNTDWGCPPMLMDTLHPLSDSFESKFAAGGVEFGVVRLPHNSADAIDILDGQHRVLGWKIITDRIHGDYKIAAERLRKAKQSGDVEGQKHAQEAVDKHMQELARLENEFITIEILEGVSLDEHKQLFHDIATNAKGITKSITMSFDRRNVMNRVAMSLAEEHPLLEDRTDFEKDRVAGRNPNFLSGRNVVDIVKAANIGIDGRMTVRREKTFTDPSVERIAEAYFDALVECFPDLEALTDDDRDADPLDLRDSSLLASPTILRILAGVFHNIAVDSSDPDKPILYVPGVEQVKTLYRDLAPHMGLPIADEWFATDYFPEKDSKAPSSRAQDLKGLTDLVTTWVGDGLPFV